VSIPANRTILF